jgi:hypothetical protein
MVRFVLLLAVVGCTRERLVALDEPAPNLVRVPAPGDLLTNDLVEY